MADDFAALELLGPADVIIPQGRVHLERLVGSRTDVADGIVRQAIKSYRKCIELAPFMVLPELIEAYNLEYAGQCRKAILIELVRHIFNLARASLIFKLEKMPSKSAIGRPR